MSGTDGWLAWTAAKGVASAALDERAADRVAQFLYFRTSGFTLGMSSASEVLAAIAQFYDEETH